MIKLVHDGWREGEEWEKARNWHENQWKIELKSLKSFLEE